MKAEIVQVKCQHLQDYGKMYFALAIILEDDSKILLRVPMWQYDHKTTRETLAEIETAVNRQQIEQVGNALDTTTLCIDCGQPIKAGLRRCSSCWSGIVEDEKARGGQ